MPRARLKRTDQPQIDSAGIGEEVVRRARDVHLREPVLPALLGGFDRDALPFRLLLCGALRIEPHDGARGKERENFGRSDFDGLLDDEIHVFSSREGLRESNSATERWGNAFVQGAQLDACGIDRGDLSSGFATVAVKEDDARAWLEPKNMAGMVRLGPAEGERARMP